MSIEGIIDCLVLQEQKCGMVLAKAAPAREYLYIRCLSNGRSVRKAAYATQTMEHSMYIPLISCIASCSQICTEISQVPDTVTL